MKPADEVARGMVLRNRPGAIINYHGDVVFSLAQLTNIITQARREGAEDMREQAAKLFEMRARNSLGGRARQAHINSARQVRSLPLPLPGDE